MAKETTSVTTSSASNGAPVKETSSSTSGSGY